MVTENIIQGQEYFYAHARGMRDLHPLYVAVKVTDCQLKITPLKITQVT